MKRSKKRIAAMAIAGILVVSAGTCGVIYASGRASAATTETAAYKETTVMRGKLTTGVTESGSVAIAAVSQAYELGGITITSTSVSTDTSGSSGSTGTAASGGMSSSGSTGTGSAMSAGGSSGSGNSSTGGTSTSISTSASTSDAALVVETVYVAAGQIVAAGDPLYKLTEDSITAYRTALQTAITSAGLAVKSAQISRDESALSADYTYQAYIAAGQTAESEYNATIASLQYAVTSAQAAVTSAAETVSTLQTRQANGEDVTTALASAQSSYENAAAQLQSAQNALTTGSISAKATYEETMLNYQNAESLKDIETDGLDDDLTDAQETLADAQAAMSDFEAYIGDGVICSAYAGTVMSVGYAAGDSLSTTTALATFADASAVTMTVSVSQEDISSIAIGNQVDIDTSLVK